MRESQILRHQAFNVSVKTSLLLIVVSSVLTGTLSSIRSPAFALTVPEWKVSCRAAYHLQKDLRFQEAYNEYNNAFNELGGVDNKISREIQLNMAVMLRLSGRLERALSMLQTMAPKFAKDKSSLQAMRYWRRLRDVYTDMKNIGRAIEAQRNVLEIARANFEFGSPLYLDEVRRLIDLLGESMQLSEAATLATQVSKFMPEYTPDSRERLSNAIDTINSRVIRLARELQSRGKYEESLESLHLIKACLPAKRYIEELKILVAAPMPFQPKLKQKIQLEVDSAIQNESEKK